MDIIKADISRIEACAELMERKSAKLMEIAHAFEQQPSDRGGAVSGFVSKIRKDRAVSSLKAAAEELGKQSLCLYECAKRFKVEQSRAQDRAEKL